VVTRGGRFTRRRRTPGADPLFDHVLSSPVLSSPASASNSVRSVMRSAGSEKGVGIISVGFLKDPTDPQWQDTAEYKEWLAWMKTYNSSANVADAGAVYGYSVAQTIVAVLKARGDDLTRENIMKGGKHPQSEAADVAAGHHCLD
jgi:hypothetical protein